MYIFSVTALSIHNPKQAEINSTQKRQREHAYILIVHLHLNRSFPELTFLHDVSVFNIDHVREEKEIE